MTGGGAGSCAKAPSVAEVATSPPGGEIEEELPHVAGMTVVLRFAFTPTLYPSPQVGGGFGHQANLLIVMACASILRKSKMLKASLPPVGRDRGWG